MRTRSKIARSLLAQIRAADDIGALESGQKEAAVKVVRSLLRAARAGDRRRVESAVEELVRIFLKQDR